jgi:lysophospholipid acyltransferase (LPLAT)-like uncharacterized protein
MSPLKSLVKKRAVQRCLSWLAALYVRFVYLTGRWRTVGLDEVMASNNSPLIIAFWHGRMLMMPCRWPRAMPIRMLISRHGDGVLIADTIAHFGIGTIQGSTRHGGAEALRDILKTLKSGISVGVTPDGPRGPRMHCTGAVADIARMSGTPILPVSYSARRRVILGSWDGFLLPLPFTRGVYVVGDLIEAPRDGDEAATLQRLETHLNELTRRADDMMGVESVQPAVLQPAGASRT